MDSHFAKKLFSQTPVMEALAGRPMAQLAPGRSFQTSPRAASSPYQGGSNPLINLPTLGNTGVKLNSSRWGGATGADGNGVSVFDAGAAYETLKNGPEPDGRRMTPAAIAHANRIQRHAQNNATLVGFKLLPDLTPGRAFVWGSILAAWTVGSACAYTCRSLDINSRAEFPVKMKEAFAPVRVWAQSCLAPIREAMTFETQPLALANLQAFGSTYRRQVSKSRSPDADSLTQFS